MIDLGPVIPKLKPTAVVLAVHDCLLDDADLHAKVQFELRSDVQTAPLWTVGLYVTQGLDRENLGDPRIATYWVMFRRSRLWTL